MKALVSGVGLALLALALALGCAEPRAAGASAATPNKLRQDVVSALTDRGDAKSLATAAAVLTRTGAPPPAALDLIAHANELAPQDPAIGWLHLKLCIEAPACDWRDVATAMRWVDPDNGAAWMPILAIAQREHDRTEINRVLADMAQGTRFDLYWNKVITMWFDTLQDAKPALPRAYAMTDAARFAELTAMAAAHLIPPFGPLAGACKESKIRSERFADCLKLAKIMQRGDTVVTQMAGFNLEKTLLAADGKDLRSVTERKNLLEWRTNAAAKLDFPLPPSTAGSRIQIRLAEMRLRRREEDVCMALLRDHQKALEPTEKHR